MRSSSDEKAYTLSFARLRTAFGEEAPCRTTIYTWFAEFKRGRVSLKDEFRDGRPSTTVNNKNIDATCRMIVTNRPPQTRGRRRLPTSPTSSAANDQEGSKLKWDIVIGNKI
ncbi:Putative uncharacterized protein FLJ37770 [Eumeta japonica]|uniref:Mos1 transposase HTH domain-containing protein n=1 Tax=Eumeta variegata TaxID=151549 RepID=A0A4C1Y6G8_EUMVA|nr:Putative uncharacterized protein FLJ37770 [Eumeta japonica]